MFFRRLRKKQRPDPSGFKWIAAAILIYAVIAKPSVDHTLVEQRAASPSSEASPVQSLKESITTTLGWDQVAGSILPQTVPTLRIEDSQPSGDKPAICGQRVTLTYIATDDKGAPLPDSRDEKNPLVFTVGGKSVMPALEEGVVGMNIGGERTLRSPFHLAYGASGFTRPDIAPETNVVFKVKLLAATPSLPDSSGFRVMGSPANGSDLIRCGEIAKLQVDISSTDGKPLYSSRKTAGSPIQFTVGQSEVFLGLEQGVLGLQYGEKRTLLVPPSLQRTLKGTPPLIDFSLPKNQTILVDIEALP